MEAIPFKGTHDALIRFFSSVFFFFFVISQILILVLGGGHWEVPNTAVPQKISINTVIPQKKIGKYRNTASKVDEIPKSQKRGILFTLCSPADKNCVV